MKFTLYRDQAGEWRWRLRAKNGRIVAEGGEGYKRYSAMVRTLNGLFETGAARVALNKAIGVVSADGVRK